jgi:CheY-like chemotaxis protein
MINLLLADDDKDDRLFFDIALSEIDIPTQLHKVTDGEKLMTYLSIHIFTLPDILFLDLNMPRKTGQECLSDIKSDSRLCQLPVIIYSTCLQEDLADSLYELGAHYYIQKTDIPGLQNILRTILTLQQQKKLSRPDRTRFMLSAKSKAHPGIEYLLQ